MKKINYASMFTLRKDGRYQGYWRDEKGKRHAVCDRDPERLYQRINDISSPKPVTFADEAKRWEERTTVSPRTWQNYAARLNELLEVYGDTPVTEITALTISAALQRYKARGYSRTVVNNAKVVVSQVLEQAVADGLIPFNVAQTVKLPKGLPKGTRRAPTDEEIRKIIAAKDIPFGLFAFLCLCTGLRKGEALALTKADIDLKNNRISVTKALTWIDGNTPTVKEPKSASGFRTIPIISVLRPSLEKALKEKGQVLFPQSPSKRNPSPSGYMSERAYDCAWARYCKEAGLDITAHSLRHGTATLLFEAGVDVHTAQRILGHAQVTTTLSIYTELREKQQQESIVMFNDRMANLMAE